ncbi:MAG: insulinase family protein [Candidatus Eremiobacteraeota bacterium]|nr:insulinase family protein [Candidatus Eremiobacteraeota bacterium]
MRANILTALVVAAGVAAAVSPASAQESQIVPGATSTPPPAAAPRTVQYPTPVATTLPNGLRVLAARVPGSALVAADLTVAGGAVADPDTAPGVASLTASLLTRGTAKRTAKEVAFTLDALGATLVASPSSDRTDVVTDAVAARFPAALALLAEAVRQPAFAPAEVVLAKQRATSSVMLQSGSPSALASLVAQRALFAGAFGRPASGTARSIAAIDREAVVAYHRAHYRPDGAILTIVGDLAPADAFALAQTAFGDWTAPPGPLATPAPAVAAAPRIVVVDQPAAGRTAIVVAHAGPLRTSADWASAMVANAVLSGYSGRLNEEIRVKRGLSYGAGSAYATGRYAGNILASTLVEHAKAPEALDIMLSTISSLGSSAPASADELLARRTSMLGGLASGIETIGGLVRGIALNAFAGLPLDALSTMPAELAAVEPAAVTRFAAAGLSTPPTIVLVGDSSKFIDAVRKAHPDVLFVKATDLDLTSPGLARLP